MAVRRWHVAVLALLAALVLACEGSGKAGGPRPDRTARPGLPDSIAALGDSISAGYGACPTLVVCGRHSWATGTAPHVDSHYQRILADNPQIRGRRHNYAAPGARAAALAGQAASAVRTRAQYVTILIGANDACRPSVTQMTPRETFRRQVDAALARLAEGLPRARVLVASVPDLYRLWEVGHRDDRAVRAWSRGTCPSLLADPRSTAPADTARRRLVDAQVAAYNRELAAACRAYGPNCRYDGGAAHRVRFGLDLVSHLDYFHPNGAGQARLAQVTFSRRFLR